MSARKPKILLIDIETFPNLITSWGLMVPGGYLSPENIVRERSIICVSYKWLGEKKVYSLCVDAGTPFSDFGLVGTLVDILHEADAVVAHNGDRFDLPWIRTRAIYHGYRPTPPIIQIDTKKLAKKRFNFNSNKLEYLANFLGLGAKIKTDFTLWKECMNGDKKALETMTKYCQHDVELLEKVYLLLAPYVPTTINRRLFVERPVCPTCESDLVQCRGFAYLKVRKYQRYWCMDCGHWFRDTKAVRP